MREVQYSTVHVLPDPVVYLDYLFIFSHTHIFFFFFFYLPCTLSTWLVHGAVIGGRARGGIVSCFVLASCVYLYVWCS